MASRSSVSFGLVPVEALLAGAWIAATLVSWVARRSHFELLQPRHLQPLAAELDRVLTFRLGIGEAILGAFLVLLALRRRARGLSLLLPFVAFTIALAFILHLVPAAAAGAAAPDVRLARVHGAAYVLDAVKVVVLFGLFLLLPQSRGRRS